MRYDGRLVRAARELLPKVPSRAGEAIDLAEARRAAQRFGWTDGQLAAIGLRVPATEDVSAALSTELKSVFGNVSVNRIGVAAKTMASDTAVLVLLSRRMADLEPIPARVTRGAVVRVAGTARHGQQPENGEAPTPGAECRERRTQQRLLSSRLRVSKERIHEQHRPHQRQGLCQWCTSEVEQAWAQQNPSQCCESRS